VTIYGLCQLAGFFEDFEITAGFITGGSLILAQKTGSVGSGSLIMEIRERPEHEVN
jgi:hypothetical protein